MLLTLHSKRAWLGFPCGLSLALGIIWVISLSVSLKEFNNFCLEQAQIHLHSWHLGGEGWIPNAELDWGTGSSFRAGNFLFLCFSQPKVCQPGPRAEFCSLPFGFLLPSQSLPTLPGWNFSQKSHPELPCGSLKPLPVCTPITTPSPSFPAAPDLFPGQFGVLFCCSNITSIQTRRNQSWAVLLLPFPQLPLTSLSLSSIFCPVLQFDQSVPVGLCCWGRGEQPLRVPKAGRTRAPS